MNDQQFGMMNPEAMNALEEYGAQKHANGQ
jgi:hypothetical protein